jgi:hypothetical protein
LTTEVVEVPEWGGSVNVRTLTGTERDEFEQSFVQQDGKSRNLRNFRAKLCARAMVDDDGEPMFTAKDVDALGKKNGRALDRVFDVAQQLAGLSEKDVDELVKNSESGQSDGSTSD